jgi:hypothetical protein
MLGTPKVGYMGPDAGPFRCGSCNHYKETDKGSGCNQKEVIAELGAGKTGLAAIDQDGCCNEFEPKERPKDDPASRMLEIVRKRKKAS